MSKFIGKGAVINNPDGMCHGKPCVIAEYVKATRKYRVDFDGGWTGWYHLKQLKIDK